MTTTKPNPAADPKRACTRFNPMVSEIFGTTKRCRDCGATEAAHDLNAQDFNNIEFIAALCGIGRHQ